jgi:hypothetical protein
MMKMTHLELNDKGALELLIDDDTTPHFDAREILKSKETQTPDLI